MAPRVVHLAARVAGRRGALSLIVAGAPSWCLALRAQAGVAASRLVPGAINEVVDTASRGRGTINAAGSYGGRW